MEHKNQYPIFSSWLDAQNYRNTKYTTFRERSEHAVTALGYKQPDSQYYIVTNDPTYSDPVKHEEWLVYMEQIHGHN